MAGMGAAALGRRFRDDGYAVLERLFPAAEVAGWKAEIGRVLPATGAHREHGVYVGLALLSPMLKAAAADPRLVAPLTAVIGPDVEFLSDKLVFKSAGMDYGSPWHQDWTYWHGIHKVSTWIALDDATRENGCLKLLPGSHTRAVEHGGKGGDGKGFDNRLRPGDVDETKAVVAAVPAGSVIVFHDLLLHASFPNTSGKDRWALISTYRDASVPDPCDEIEPWKHAFAVAGRRRTRAHS